MVQAVSALDRLGAMTGLLLRRHSYVRVAFALYVAVIHLWVLFILFHLIGEMEGSASTAAPVALVGAQAGNARTLLPSLLRNPSDGLGNG